MASEKKKFVPISSEDSGTQVVDESLSAPPKKSDETEKEPLEQVSHKSAVIDFNAALDQAHSDAEPDQTEPDRMMIEMEDGATFRVAKFKNSTLKYISVLNIVSTQEELDKTIKMIKRVLVREDRDRFYEWFNERCEEITDRYEEWEDSDQTDPAPMDIEDWIVGFFTKFSSLIEQLVKEHSQKK